MVSQTAEYDPDLPGMGNTLSISLTLHEIHAMLRGRKGDFYRVAQLDGQFHTQIVEATGNRYFSGFSR